MVNSSMCLNFSNSAGFVTGPVPTAISDNFGVEGWFYSSSTSGNQVMFYNGNPGGNGWGFGLSGANWEIFYGGVVFQQLAPATINVWNHVALVESGGNATLYVNGVSVGSTSATPNPPSGSLSIGAAPDSSSPLIGMADEVSIFTFAPGTFSTNYLLYYENPGPTITGVAASAVTSSNETLTATVNPNASGTAQVWFEYGLTAAYGNFTGTNTLAASPAQGVTNFLTGLQPATLYHYRVDSIATGTAVVNSPDAAFTTLDIPRTLSPGLQSSNGQLLLQFNGSPNGNYTILTSTNLTLPLTNWTSLGAPVQISSGVYRFTNTAPTNVQGYYLLKE